MVAPTVAPAGLLKTITTEDDASKIYEPIRVIAVTGALLFFGLTIWTVCVQAHEFRYLEFGAGLGALLTAVGAGLGIQAKLGG